MENITEKDLFMRVIKSIEGLEEGSNKVVITFIDGSSIIQMHDRDCCEVVEVKQVDNDPTKFIGAVVYKLDEKVLSNEGILGYSEESFDSLTATFYTLKTSKGYLDWHWYGESNGYYSETVDCTLRTYNG